MYFKKFPKIEYNGTTMPDISIRYKINKLVKESVNTYELYRLSEGEKPEDVSYRMYGDVTYHWVVLMMNDIADPFDGWFRNDEEMEIFLTDKYAGEIDSVHHYEDADGYYINDYADTSTNTITNREYEESLNDNLREIKVLRPAYLSQLITEFESTING